MEGLSWQVKELWQEISILGSIRNRKKEFDVSVSCPNLSPGLVCCLPGFRFGMLQKRLIGLHQALDYYLCRSST